MIRLVRAGMGMIIGLAAMALLQLPALADQCQDDEFEGTRYIICTHDPAQTELQLFWKGADGEPYRHFSELAKAVESKGGRLTWAMNAGMYLPDFSPSGLYVENGIEMRPANKANVEGPPAKVPNFYKQPNGVFFIDESGAGILPTALYLERRPAARLATQSGPMLVIDNGLHPAFIEGSSDRTRRDGVGVCTDGLVRFAISEDRVNFHDFARLFRDRLQCPNALFLDGGRGVGLYSPELRRDDRSWHGGFGPIFGLVE